MIDLPAPIIGAEKITAIFGYWPSFHDAELIELVLHRGSINDSGPTLAAKVHTFKMTREVNARGSYVCKNHCVVTIRFSWVENVEIAAFNHQNALMGITISGSSPSTRGSFNVRFESAFGADATFLCRTIEVVNVESFIPPDSVYAQQ